MAQSAVSSAGVTGPGAGAGVGGDGDGVVGAAVAGSAGDASAGGASGGGTGGGAEAPLPKGFRDAEDGWPRLDRIPHPPHRLPLLGDLFSGRRLRVSRPLQDTMAMGRGLGPIFRRKAFGKEIVFVWGAGLTADICDETRFAKHVGLGVANLRPVAGDGLFTAYNHEPNWQLAHDILAPAFSRNAMAGYHPVMLDVAGRLIDRWDAAERDGEEVDVSGDMTKLTLETIARTGFGHDFGSFERSEPHPFVTAMVGGLSFAQRRNLVPPLVLRTAMRGAMQRNERDLELLNQTVDEVVEARRAAGGSDGSGDLLDRMLAVAHPETGERLSARNIRHQVVTFLVAGHETTSGALSFALYYLAKHPEVLARAREEADRIWPDGAEPSYEQVAKARYLRRVLDESLRLWPTAPAFAREARQDTVLGGEDVTGGAHPMRRGAWALVLAGLLHRDPEAWGEDAESFDPERFAPEAVRGRPAHVFKPFGTGARACIGRQFALHEAVLVLGLLVRRYELEPDPGYRLSVAERLTLMPAGFRLRLHRR
ncbi:cytochrome P450 [Phaeacidiphilus oryzae]|uniref:cytochrome P450 n=1 Tax=Phaeacidiphilus oryzae TaxID=348818 RepID=UPI000A05ADF1|nr:cytochrome P450 [Phaeacidiphilus oryzae]